jgi:nicotinamide riboside transporter PnuC
MQNISWLLVALSMVGTFLNAKRKRSGFLVWMVANVGLVAYNISIEQWALALMFAAYFALAIYGWIEWGKRDVNSR